MPKRCLTFWFISLTHEIVKLQSAVRITTQENRKLKSSFHTLNDKVAKLLKQGRRERKKYERLHNKFIFEENARKKLQIEVNSLKSRGTSGNFQYSAAYTDYPYSQVQSTSDKILIDRSSLSAIQDGIRKNSGDITDIKEKMRNYAAYQYRPI